MSPERFVKGESERTPYTGLTSVETSDPSVVHPVL